MKPLKHHRQSPGLCGPASLQILLSHYGKEFTEDELSKLCEATAEHGTDHSGLIKAVEALGERPVVKTGASIEDLRHFVERETPVIVGWWNDTEDHYSVAYELDDETISMMDPQLEEGTRTMAIPDFEKAWYDFDGPENVRVDRWMMAIPPFNA